MNKKLLISVKKKDDVKKLELKININLKEN